MSQVNEAQEPITIDAHAIIAALEQAIPMLKPIEAYVTLFVSREHFHRITAIQKRQQRCREGEGHFLAAIIADQFQELYLTMQTKSFIQTSGDGGGLSSSVSPSLPRQD